MRIRLPYLLATAVAATLGSGAAEAAGKYGFADKPGGGPKDPVIEVSATIAPGQGATFSYTPEQANELYQFDPLAGVFKVTVTPPVLPASITVVDPETQHELNQFIRLKFPMKLNKKLKKSLAKDKPAFAATSYLTENLIITDETGAHVPGIPVFNGKAVHATAQGKKVKQFLPSWLNPSGKNLLVGKNVFVYVADQGDFDLSTASVFAPTNGSGTSTTKQEVRIALREIGGVTVNGFWVLKIGSPDGEPKVASITATDPKGGKVINGLQVVDSSSEYVLTFTEPVVPESVGFDAKQVSAFNATNPVIPMLYNGNTATVPNPENLAVPFFPNLKVTATPNQVATFPVPFNVRPRNPNNLAEYLIEPLLDLPNNVELTVQPIAAQNNANPTALPGVPSLNTAAISLYDNQFNDASEDSSEKFLVKGGRAWTNAPVAPQALYYAPLTGGGIGVVNLDGNGFETNDPATSKLMLVTNLNVLSTCPFPNYINGCTQNTYGDPTAANPIGLGGNLQGHLGGPTPVPGVNEGSTDSTASSGNPLFQQFPPGFETVVKNSEGNPRLTAPGELGAVGDIQVGDFLDKLFFDTSSPYATPTSHISSVTGATVPSNTISDPPVPNPPPLRLPVGLPPLDIVFNQQNLKKPAFVIEGEEVFSHGWNDPLGLGTPPLMRANVLLLPNKINPQGADQVPPFAQNGPTFQTSTSGLIYPYYARQQIGNFLYVTDRDQGVLKVLNSNNFSVLKQINLPDPEGLGIAPDLRTIYVSNFGDDSLSIVDTNPYSATFHKEINRVKVEAGPRAVSVQPENEDVFVANFLGNSISIYSPASMTIRKTLADNVKRPWDIVLTPRHFTTGWLAQTYFGFISSTQTGQLLIYESGPGGSTGVGSDSIRWTAQTNEPFADMRGLVYDPATYTGSATNLPGGAFVTHRDADTGMAMVSRVAWTKQSPQSGPLPPIPIPNTLLNQPGALQRVFEVVAFWGGPLSNLSALNFGGQDQTPYDVTLNDFSAENYFSQILNVGYKTNIGALAGGGTFFGANSKHPHRPVPGGVVATWMPDRLYVSFPGDSRIEVIDPRANGQSKVNTINNVPTVGVLASYFDQ